MTSHLLKALLVGSLAVGALQLAACTSLPTVPAAGSTIDASFWKSFLPTYKKGQKWTYTITTSGAATSSIVQEVTDVTGDTATLTTMFVPTPAGFTPAIATASVSNPGGQFTSGGVTLVSQGSEDVTVAGKTYGGAAKTTETTTTGSTKNFWFAPQIGLVKELVTASGSTTPSVTMELSSFVQP